jgi:enoyl-CoA hydratase/carnithine racemase
MTDLLETAEDGIAWLTLNRPDRLNAFSPAMLTALGEALQRLGSDAGVGAIIITGAGRGFCAGGDVKTMASRANEGFEERVEGLRRMHQLPLLLRTIPKVVIAMVNGPAVGAGLGLAMACDLRIAGRSVRPFRHGLRRGRLFRRFRRLVELDPAGRHGQGARALFSRRHHRQRDRGLAWIGHSRRR